jgi:hypothetical protein
MATTASSLLGMESTSMSAILLDEAFADLQNQDRVLQKARALIEKLLAGRNDDGVKNIVLLVVSLLTKNHDARSLLPFLRETYLNIFDAGAEKVFAATKMSIIEAIGELWQAKMDDVSQGAFSFLCAIYPSLYLRAESAPAPDEKNLQGARASLEEGKAIDAIVRKKVGDKNSFTPQAIEAWMRGRPERARIPRELMQALEINWVRNGGNLAPLLRLSKAIGASEFPEWAYPILRRAGKQLRTTERFEKDFLREAHVLPDKQQLDPKHWNLAGSIQVRHADVGRIKINVLLPQMPADCDAVRKKIDSILSIALRRVYHQKTHLINGIDVVVIKGASEEDPASQVLQTFALRS